MTDLRALLGDKYEATIEKVTDAIGGDTDFLGCGCCTAHDALAAVLPDLLADAWDEGHDAGCADPHAYYDLCGCGPNPYRPETTAGEATGAPVTLAAPDAINPPPNPSLQSRTTKRPPTDTNREDRP